MSPSRQPCSCCMKMICRPAVLMIIIQARQLVETEVPPQLQCVRLMLHLLSPYPHALCFSLSSAGFLSQSEWPDDYLLWRGEKIRRRERYCRYTQWEREREKHFLTMGLEIAVRVRCYPEDKYGYSWSTACQLQLLTSALDHLSQKAIRELNTWVHPLWALLE